MNWSKAKNILIILFICADIFLAFVALFFTGNIERTPAEITEAAAEIIKKGGIDVDASLLSTGVSSVNIPELKNIISDNDAFAKQLLGDDCKKTSGTYSSEKGELCISGDTFSFVPKSIDGISAMSKTPSATGRQVLAALGIKDKNILCTFSEKGNILNISKQSNGMTFFCSSIDAEFSGSEIIKISGSWYCETGRHSPQTQLKPISSLLIDCTASLNGEKKTVQKIIPGYYIQNKDNDRVFPTPCIKIMFTDGSELVQNSAETQNL